MSCPAAAPFAIRLAALAALALFVAGCVSTTLDVPETHPASPSYPSAPVPSVHALSAEAMPSSSSASPPAHDHSHQHDHSVPAPAGHH